MDGMKSIAKAFDQPLEKVKKINLSGQWFSPDPVLASGYADKLGKTKYVDVTPAEYEMMKRYKDKVNTCLLYTSPSPRDRTRSRMPSSA